MATATIALAEWNAEYYETMAAATRVWVAVQSGANHLRLAHSFRSVANDFDTLLTLLREFDTTSPSTVLLEEQSCEIPGKIRTLFRKTCALLESCESRGLNRSWLMADFIARVNLANQEIAVFADRFETAQRKLQTYVPRERTAEYLESIRAYKDSELSSDVAGDDDVKSKGLALHF